MKIGKIIPLFFVLSVLFIFIEPLDAGAIRIRCASTTSTQNSGFFDYLLPKFEKKNGIKVDIIAVGTGQALEIGKRGDVDLVIVHSKEDEIRMVREGYFVERLNIMYNDFIILGPSDDPAGIKGLKTAPNAFRKIAASGKSFMSRGDNSGTHKTELKIWQEAKIDPREKRWYIEVGQGMENTLRVADQKRGYTLTDRGTWLSTKDRNRFNMEILVEGDPLLFNQYGIMAVNPSKHPHTKYREAKVFIDWIVSPAGQKAIADFKDRQGNAIFIPNAK